MSDKITLIIKFCRCGMRGGYFEVIGLDPEVRELLIKSISAKLCSPVTGQVSSYLLQAVTNSV